MNVLSQFSLPYRGLGNGEHRFEFEVLPAFFKKFENDDFERCHIEVVLSLDKKSDRCLLHFEIDGTKAMVCDRCTSEMNFPIKGSYELHVKFGQGSAGGDTDEIVFMDAETSILDVSTYVYEFIVLSLPLIATCDSDPDMDCDESVLKHLDPPEEAEDEEGTSGLWDSLKGIDFNN